MEKESNIGKKVLISVLGVLLILMIAAIVLLFVKNSVSAKKSGKQQTEQQEEDKSAENDYQEAAPTEFPVDDFSVGTDSDDNKSSDDSESTENYILPDSDSKYLTDEDLYFLSTEEISLARNEIYARHGYIFDKEELNTYFKAKAWYEPTYTSDSFPEEELNQYEKQNVIFIKEYEEKNDWE